MTIRALFVTLLASLAIAASARADTGQFDLVGPRLVVSVTRGGATLPIAQVPDLAAGDQLSVKAELPPPQGAHYVLITAFLRGATNPPPVTWFAQAQTWTPKGRDGLKVVVPEGAQQVLVFLAPQTHGDFHTLMGAVRGKPGAFVRASQDLNQAALDHSRLDTFLAAVRRPAPADPDRLKTVTPLLARSLTIKVNADCFQKIPELQAACLMQGQDSLVLNDGHSASLAEGLTTGSVADLTMQLSATPRAGYGYYSAYVGAVSDIVRILGSLHTAQYQYIPALAASRDDHLALLLNTPPSFHKPQSVLVTALPTVQPPQPPPFQLVDPKAAYCAARPDLVLQVEGAPLAFSTRYARNLVLRLKAKDGRVVELPLSADAEKGGLVVDAKGLASADFPAEVDGVVHGDWGFTPFDGPVFHLQTAQAGAWRLNPDDEQSLVVGRDDPVRLDGQGAACVRSVSLQLAGAAAQPVEWKATSPDRLTVTAPLTGAAPGDASFLIDAYGLAAPQAVAAKAYTQAGHIDGFTLFAGDQAGALKGNRLDEVAGVSISGIDFRPQALTSMGGEDELTLQPADPLAMARFKAGQSLTAKVALKDGRTLNVKGKVGPSRPRVALVDRSIQAAAAPGRVDIQLGGADQLPQNGRITFSVRAPAPMRLSAHDTVEAATVDGAASVALTAADGLTLADPQVAVAALDAAKAFNASTFGPLQFRLVHDGVAGDWQPLAVLVRLPALREVKCAAAAQPCQLSGDNLFLIDSLSADPAFAEPVSVPAGFAGQTLQVPHPRGGKLYLKLRDNPGVVDVMTVTPAGR